MIPISSAGAVGQEQRTTKAQRYKAPARLEEKPQITQMNADGKTRPTDHTDPPPSRKDHRYTERERDGLAPSAISLRLSFLSLRVSVILEGGSGISVYLRYLRFAVFDLF